MLRGTIGGLSLAILGVLVAPAPSRGQSGPSPGPLGLANPFARPDDPGDRGENDPKAGRAPSPFGFSAPEEGSDARKVAMDLGGSYFERGEFREAARQFARAVTLAELDPDDANPRGPLSLADALCMLGRCQAELKEFDEAGRSFRRAVRLVEEAVGPDSLILWKFLRFEAAAATRGGDPRGAERSLRRALAIIEKAAERPEQDLRVAQTLEDLAEVAIDRKHFSAAEPPAKRALAICDALWGENRNPELAALICSLSFELELAARKLSRPDESERYFGKILAVIDAMDAPDAPAALRALASFEGQLREKKLDAEADRVAARIASIRRDVDARAALPPAPEETSGADDLPDDPFDERG